MNDNFTNMAMEEESKHPHEECKVQKIRRKKSPSIIRKRMPKIEFDYPENLKLLKNDDR